MTQDAVQNSFEAALNRSLQPEVCAFDLIIHSICFDCKE